MTRAHAAVTTRWTWRSPEPFVEPTPRRIRVRLGGLLVAGSDRAQLLVRYDAEGLPTYFLPAEDVRAGMLVEQVDHPDGRRTWTVQAGPVRAERAAWTHLDPTGPMSALAGHVTFSWRQVEWFEEDEPVGEHARDPYKRVDTRRSSRRVQIGVGGVPVADSVRPLLLFETGLPTRYYLPFDDVRTELLEPSESASTCPFKGHAQYWSIRAGGLHLPDAVWSYPDPIPENPKIRGLACFLTERVDLELDGVPVERPVTPWTEHGIRTEIGVAHARE